MILHSTWLPEISVYVRRLAPDAEAPGFESIEGVGAPVILLRVGLATLRLLLYIYVCTANEQERVAFLDQR
jgi:hypothetical protein